jgi:hypothetical protein
MKCDTTKLHSEDSLALLEMNLLVLVVQLIMLCEDIGSRMASAGSDRPDKLTDLNDSIRRQMVQLHSEFAQDVCENQMWRHTELGSEKFFEGDNFVCPGLWHGLRAKGSAISLGEIASAGLHRLDTGFHDTR